MSPVIRHRGIAAGFLAGTLLLALPGAVGASQAPGIATLPGYHVSVFVHGTSAWTNPDAIVVTRHRVYIDYQNHSAKDGSTTAPSTIVEYRRDGDVVRSFSIPGHSDGLRLDPAGDALWATVNEDANPALFAISLKTGAITRYSLATPHGGGYDDLVFVGGRAILVASNPTLNAAGVNVFPALVAVTLHPDHSTTLTPILMGNAMAFDTISGGPVTLNLVDPDSLAFDLAGNLILVDQGGSELITIAHPGSPSQAVSRLAVGTQLDDTVWARSSHGSLFVVDATANTTYILRDAFTRGTTYTETPNDSGVAGLVGIVDPATGIVTPVAIGFGKPTGMAWSRN
jgi:hypothetical protein